MLTLLTTTGCRPDAWKLCQRWMAAQTYTGPVRWVVVDDGEVPQAIELSRSGWDVQVIRPAQLWKPGMNTQATNLLAGLKVIGRADRLVIIEDDDHYAPDWLGVVDEELDQADLVGETKARYYNVATRQYRQLSNMNHASLCATAMKGRGIEFLMRCSVPGVQFIDMSLWKQSVERSLFKGHRVVGIKGMPGRNGIGMGHRPGPGWAVDHDGSVLASWVGDDAVHYEGFRHELG